MVRRTHTDNLRAACLNVRRANSTRYDSDLGVDRPQLAKWPFAP
jgi:hypothetical protein